MEFKITLLFHCYSSGIPIKISVTFPLVLFHWYSTVFIIKIPMEFHWYFFHLICHKIPLLFQRSYAYQWLFFQFYLVNIFPLSFQRKAVKYHCNFEGHICEMSIRVIKPVTCPLVCFSLLVSHINATLNCQPLLHGKKHWDQWPTRNGIGWKSLQHRGTSSRSSIASLIQATNDAYKFSF